MKKICVGIAIAVGLSGCGGGGGDGGGVTAPLPPPINSNPTGTLTGSATKGIIRNAAVVISEFDAQGTAREIGAGTTDENGNYSVTYAGYAGGLIEACVRATELTTVVCDATDGGGDNACGPANGGAAAGDTDNDGFYDLGEAIPAPQDFALCTRLPGPPVNGIRAPITPFTDLVARRADQRDVGGEDALSALLRAASEINQLAGGLDVLRLEPVNLADAAARAGATPNQLVYSALLAAVLGNAVEEQGTLDLAGAIAALRDEAADGNIGIAAFRALIDEAGEQLAGMGYADHSGVLATLDALAADCEADSACTGFDPEAANNAGNGHIERAKNLVANVRDTLHGLGDLEAPAQAFGDQVALASVALGAMDGPADDLLGDLGFAIEAAMAFVELQTQDDGTIANGTATLGENEGNVNDALEPQSATLTISGDAVKTVTVAGNVRDAVADLTVTLPDDVNDSTATQLVVSLAGSTFETAGAGEGLRLIVNAGDVTVSKTSGTFSGAADEGLIVNAAGLDLQVTLEQINTPAEQAGGPMAFTGTLGGTLVRCTAASCTARETQDTDGDGRAEGATFFGSAFGLSGHFAFLNDVNDAEDNDSVAMSVEATVANAASFDPESPVSQSNFPRASAEIVFEADLGDVAPAQVIVTGTLKGLFPQPDDGGVSLDPDAIAAVTLLRDGLQVFRVQAHTYDQGDDTLFTATVSDSGGAELTVGEEVHEGEFVDVVRVDGVIVGTLEELSNGLVIVRYEDGTFETLF